MKSDIRFLVMPEGKTKFLFFGGKGGVGKTTLATSTAVWFAEQGYKTTIISTDPTVSLSAVFQQDISSHEKTGIKMVPNLCGMNINPANATGTYQGRLNNLMGQMTGTFGSDIISTPCMEEMTAFDQFVSCLESPDSDIVVFDTAPTGKTLRELAMPFDWARFMQRQITEGKELAKVMNMDERSFADLEADKARFDNALDVLRDKSKTIFSLVLIPERLPVEETASAISGLGRLGISVQALIINQTILPEVIDGNRFLQARSNVQEGYIDEIAERFSSIAQVKLPLLSHDISNLTAMYKVGDLVYGTN